MSRIWENGKRKLTLEEAMSMDENEFRRQAGIKEEETETELKVVKEDWIQNMVKGMSPGAEDLIRTIHRKRKKVNKNGEQLY